MVGMTLTSLAIVLLIFTVATYPGEMLDTLPSMHIIPWKFERNSPWKFTSLHELLVAGEVDFSTRKATSLWSNRLVLPGIDVIDHSKFDTKDKIANMPSPVSLRARHLEGAVLIGSTLRKVDFTAAWMHDATLGSSDLREARFECDTFRQVGAVAPEVRCTDLRGASFVGSQLQASSFVGARLEGALFYRAQLQGASLLGANLMGAALDSAQLQGATLDSVRLDGASLVSAQLQGAVLDFAELRAASLDSTQLQGASFDHAKLDWASLRKIFAWRTDVRYAVSEEGARVDADTRAKESCLGLVTNVSSEATCDWSAASFTRLKQLIVDLVPNGNFQTDALSRIQRLDPAQSVNGEPKMLEAWAALQKSSPALANYEKGKADQWQQIGCLDSYVLRGLITQMENVGVAFEAKSQRLPQLAAFFLDAKQCVGAQKSSRIELDSLKAIRDYGVSEH